MNYICARHAMEATGFLATIDPEHRPDNSGMTDEEADRILERAEAKRTNFADQRELHTKQPWV